MNFRLLQIHINPKHNIKHNIKMPCVSEIEVKYINKFVDKSNNRISNMTRLLEEYDCKLGESILAFYKIEKLIFTSILNPNSKKEIFKLLLAKFDELLCNSLEIMDSRVRDDDMDEGVYLDNCNLMKKDRDRVVLFCNIQENRL